MEKRNQENFEYCKRIAKELEQYIKGDIFDDVTGEQLSIYDYFSDILDFEFLIDSQMNYKAIKVYVTLGGPTVWIDTYTKCIELRWANEKASYFLNDDTINEIDLYWEEYYNMCK